MFFKIDALKIKFLNTQNYKETPIQVLSCRKQPLGGVLKKTYSFLQADVSIGYFLVLEEHSNWWDSDFMP